jgi:nicotinic acid mononucleotide adenylyltransferase
MRRTHPLARKKQRKAMTRLAIADIIDRLSPDGQKWLRKMDRENRQTTEYTINLIGADNFVKHWQFYKELWEQIDAGNTVVVPSPRRPKKLSTPSAPVEPYSYPAGRW